MEFNLLGAITLGLNPQMQWLWYSESLHSFIAGDARSAFRVPVAAANSESLPASLTAVPAEAPELVSARSACNLPISASLYHEFASLPWHGFRFLEADAYTEATDDEGNPIGDLLRTLVFGPDYGHYVLHPATGSICALRSNSLELLRRTDNGFEPVGKTKTRGNAALAFCAHPQEPLIAYGDNYGNFYAQRYSAQDVGKDGDSTADLSKDRFGKASKIAAKERKASRLAFTAAGDVLLLGGMGYLAAYAYRNGKFAPLHEISIPVRDFIFVEPQNLLFVNQGLHGAAAYRYGPDGFEKIGQIKSSAAVPADRCLKMPRTISPSRVRMSRL